MGNKANGFGVKSSDINIIMEDCCHSSENSNSRKKHRCSSSIIDEESVEEENCQKSDLFKAVEKRDVEYLEILLEDDVDILPGYHYNKITLLGAACDNSNKKISIEVIRLLLDRKCNIDVNKFCDDYIGHIGYGPPLLKTIECCEFEAFLELLKHPKISVNEICGKEGLPILHCAVLLERDEFIEVLVKRDDIDINILSKTGVTALYLACSGGHYEIVEILLENDDCDVHAGRLNPFLVACENKNDSIVALLVENSNLDLSKLNQKDFSVLFYEKYRKNKLTILARSLVLDMIDRSKNFVEHCEYGDYTDVEKLLKKKHVNVNYVNDDGISGLFVACKFRHQNIVELLLCEEEESSNEESEEEGEEESEGEVKENIEQPKTIEREISQEKIVDVNLPCMGITPLGISCDELVGGCNIEIIEHLLDSDGIEVNWGDISHNISPLLLAIGTGASKECIFKLISDDRTDINFLGDNPLCPVESSEVTETKCVQRISPLMMAFLSERLTESNRLIVIRRILERKDCDIYLTNYLKREKKKSLNSESSNKGSDLFGITFPEISKNHTEIQNILSGVIDSSNISDNVEN